MRRSFLNTIFLVIGTAIGTGLIALPLTAVNLGMSTIILTMLTGLFVAYQTSCIALLLNKKAGKGTSIVELGRTFSGNSMAFFASLIFHLLFFALLSVYFSGATELLCSFIGSKSYSLIACLCGIGFYGIFSCNFRSIGLLNSLLSIVLISTIAFILFHVRDFESLSFQSKSSSRELYAFLPIILTSFGVQNVIPRIYDELEGNEKKIKQVLAIGLIITAIIYLAWILTVLISIHNTDGFFLQKMQQHEVNAGELILFLCDRANCSATAAIFKLLTFSAIVTSAIGVGLGLFYSIQESLIRSPRLALILITFIPTLTTILIPNAFIKILSLGAVIVTLFVIFIPYALLMKTNPRKTRHPKFLFCVLFGLVIVFSALFY